MTGQTVPAAGKAVAVEQILRARQTADRIYVDDKIKNYVLDLIIATREPEKYKLDEIKPWLSYGASPRATIYMIRAAKAYAFINGRGYVTPEDIKAVGFDVLRHRMLLTYEAEAENVTPEKIIRSLFEAIEVP